MRSGILILILLAFAPGCFGIPAGLGASALAAEGEAPAAAPAVEAPAGEAAPAPRKRRARRSSVSDESERAAERQRVRLTTGENKTVDVDFDLLKPEQVVVGNPQVVGFTITRTDEKRQIVFNPLKKGETTVTLRDPEGKIRVIYGVVVTDSNLLRRKEELTALLRDIEGLEIKIVGGKLVVDGEILVPADYARLLGVIQDEAYSKNVLNLAVLSPVALQLLAQKIQADVRAFAPDVSARVVNGLIFLEGAVDNPDKATRAVKIAEAYLPEAVLKNPLAVRAGEGAKVLDRSRIIANFIVVNPPPPRKQEKLIRVTIHFVKLSKDYLRRFGFRWVPGLTQSQASINVGADPNGGVGASGSSFTATISNLFPKLSSAQEAGYARVLRSGTVVVRSGQPASFAERASVPFIGINNQGQPANNFVETGVDFNVTPQIIGQTEDILMDLNLTQVSQDGPPRGNGPPPTSRHEVKTKIYVANNESAAVAGIASDDIRTDFNRQPAGTFEAGTEPLFTLNRSKDYSKKKSQYVIFVTPQILKDASEGTEDLKRNFRVKVK